jgi:hypothetical protein
MRTRLTFLILFVLAAAAAGAQLDLLRSDFGWRSTLNPPRLVNTKPLRLSTREYPILIIESKQAGGKLGEVAWRAGDEPFSFRNSRPFPLQGGNKTARYLLNLSVYNRSGKNIDQLVVFPAGSAGTAEIISLTASSGSLPELVTAAWQEFWGPPGHEPDPFDFMVIRSPRLFGRPFNLYLNLFLALFLLYAWRSGKRREFFGVLLAVWLLLEANSLRNNWLAVRADAKYLGKTLEQKRALINVPDYYPFLMFADKVLPPGAGFMIVTPVLYGGALANYYLYPRPYEENAPYLLLFRQPLSQELKDKYFVWKTYQRGACILKIRGGET